jgi:hypothetical protein
LTNCKDPIFHDDSDGQVRFVESVWPHKTYPILYGSVPQTWEDPNFDHEYTGFPGDNDPVDLFDVSAIEEGYVGQVKQVKILGALAMVDVSYPITCDFDGEIRWVLTSDRMMPLIGRSWLSMFATRLLPLSTVSPEAAFYDFEYAANIVQPSRISRNTAPVSPRPYTTGLSTTKSPAASPPTPSSAETTSTPPWPQP